MVKANVQQDALQACMAVVHSLGERMSALESRMTASADSHAEQLRCLRYEVRVLTEMVRNLQTPPADRQSPSETLGVAPSGGSKGSDEDGFEHLSDEARDSPLHPPAAAVAPQSPAKLPAKNSYITGSGTVARMASGITDDERTDDDESQLDETEDDREPEEESTEKEHEDDEEETETEEPKVPRIRPDQIICAKIDRRQQYLRVPRAHQPDEGGNVSETSDEDPSYYDNILDQVPDRSNKTVRSSLLSDEGSVYQSAAESVQAPSNKKEAPPAKQPAGRNSTSKTSSPPKPVAPPAAPKSSENRATNSGLQRPKNQLPVAPSPERVPAPRTAAAPLKSALKPPQSNVSAADNNNEPSDYNNSVTAMFKAGIKPPFLQPPQQPAAQPKPQAVRPPSAPQPKPRVQEEEEDEEVEQKKPPALSPPASSNSTLSTTINEDEEVLFDESVELWQYISEGNTPFRGAGRLKLVENLDLGSIYGLMHRSSKQKPKVAEFAVKKGMKLVKHQNECVLTWRCVDTSKDAHGEEVEFLCKFEKKAHLKKFEKVVKKVA